MKDREVKSSMESHISHCVASSLVQDQRDIQGKGLRNTSNYKNIK